MIIVNSGTGHFPLMWIGAGLAERGVLTRLVMAAYPSENILRWTSRVPILSRLLSRLYARKMLINDDQVESSFSAELYYQLAHIFRGRRWAGSIYAMCEKLSHLHVQRKAVRVLMRCADSRSIYHFRAGFGGISLRKAKELNMVTVCHHTLAHPLTLNFLINNQGARPTDDDMLRAESELSAEWRFVMDDINNADYVVLESEFQVETFQWAGFSMSRLTLVSHPGIDPDFRSHIVQRDKNSASRFADETLKLIYAGSLTPRKGVDDLQEFLVKNKSFPLSLEVAGEITPSSRARYNKLLSDDRVTELGILGKSDLVRAYHRATHAILPSYAEGSPRAVVEAMACGCAILTTRNSGTPVVSGETGWIFPCGSSEAIKASLEKALSCTNKWPEMSEKCKYVALTELTPTRYLDALQQFYSEVVS